MSRPSPKSSLSLSEKLRLRLRELRKRAGLTQAELVRRMGRKDKLGTQVCWLETGRRASPSLRLIADYLRACGAGFSDISDILDEYTSQPTEVETEGRAAVVRFVETLPTEVERRVDAYDIKTSVPARFKGVPPEPPDKRLEKCRKLAAAWLLRQRLEDKLHETLGQADMRPASLVRAHLASHGRTVWGILRRTRKAKPGKRKKLLEEAHEKMVKARVTTEQAIVRIEEVTTRLFRELEASGELDLLPDANVAGKLLSLKPADRLTTTDRMFEEEFRTRVNEFNMARYRVIDKVFEEVMPMLERAELVKGEYVNYRGVVVDCLVIALRTRPGSEERGRMREQAIAALAALGRDLDLGRRIADFSLARFDELKSTIPPNPRPA